MQNNIGAFEAKTHFSALLDRVSHGEEILITRRGVAVAKLSPVEKQFSENKAKQAAKRLRSLRKKLKNAGTLKEWQSYRLEGRK